MSYNLILSGDVELNLGPRSSVKNNAAKCSICNKAVGTNRKRVKCEICQHLTNVSCLNISKTQQKKIHCKNYSPGYLHCVYIN